MNSPTLVTVKSVDDCPFGITYNDGDTHLHMNVPDRNLDIYDVDIIIQERYGKSEGREMRIVIIVFMLGMIVLL